MTTISDARNNYNLNLPRYLDGSGAEDIQDIDAHLHGGIPERDIEALGRFWAVFPGVRAALFEPSGRPGYLRQRVPVAEVKAVVLEHPEFAAFQAVVMAIFAKWREAAAERFKAFGEGGQSKALVEETAESLLEAFRAAPLLDAYDVFQHFMDYAEATLRDDVYAIVAGGWQGGSKPREIIQVKNKEGKLVWPDKEDYRLGKRRFKSDLVPAALMIARYLAAERVEMAALQTDLSVTEQLLDEQREEHGAEDGLLAEVVEGEGDKQKITEKGVKARLKEIANNNEFADERTALEACLDLLKRQVGLKAKVKAAQEALWDKLDARYGTLTEPEIKALVVNDKWLATVEAAVRGEMERVSQALTVRVREIAERYASSLKSILGNIDKITSRVAGHLEAFKAI